MLPSASLGAGDEQIVRVVVHHGAVVEGIGELTRHEEVLAGGGQLQWGGSCWVCGIGPRVEEGSARRDPPAAIPGHVAALIGALALQQRSGIGQQCFVGLAGPLALEDVGQQAGSEGELEALPRQGERFDVAERQERRQVILAVEGADVFDQPLLFRGAVRRLLVGNLRRRGQQGETVACPFVEAEARCVVLRLEAGQLIRARFGGERRAEVVRIFDHIVDGVRKAVLRVGDERGRLFVAVALFGKRGLLPPVADRDLLQHVAVGVHLQRQGVGDAGVGRDCARSYSRSSRADGRRRRRVCSRRGAAGV